MRDEMLAASGAHGLRNEYGIRVTGQVALRPEGNANSDLPTGTVEVITAELDVLSEAAPLPFRIDDRVSVGEEARLKFRYIDLRRPSPRGGDPATERGQPGGSHAAGRVGLRRDRDPDPDPVHARGRLATSWCRRG